MASRGEARCLCETDFKHFGNKNGRFYCKTYHFCVIARPQRGRGNLKAEGMASRSEAREHETTKSRNSESSRSDTTATLLRKRHFTRAQACISRASASFTQSKVVFHGAALAVLRSGVPVRSVKDCRVGRKKCALLAMTESVCFSEKRSGFQNETLEKRRGTSPRKKAA